MLDCGVLDPDGGHRGHPVGLEEGHGEVGVHRGAHLEPDEHEGDAADVLQDE